MLRCRLILRFFLFVITSWLFIVVLWLFLPCPSREFQDPDQYSTTVLKAGNTLIRVYDIDDFFPYHDKSDTVQIARATGRHSFALEYKIKIKDQLLHLGSDTSLNITPPAVQPFISARFSVNVKAGDNSGVTMPWFSKADAALLAGPSDRYGQDMANISLRLRWTDKGRLELWPYSRRTNIDTLDYTPTSSPLLSLENYTPVTETHFRVVVPVDKMSSSPSYAYPIRAFIIKILKPTALALNDLGENSQIGDIVWAFICSIAQWIVVFYLFLVAMTLYKAKRHPSRLTSTSSIKKFVPAAFVSRVESKPSSDIEKGDRPD